LSPDLADVPARLRPAVSAALARSGINEGHLSIQLVDETRIQELNHDHRGRDAPTDVLSFPVDEAGPVAGPRELGDVFICEAQCHDVVEAAVHGVLHLCGHDHETDQGEMLELQDAVMAELRE
jgi:probable rRNA maturation factor